MKSSMSRNEFIAYAHEVTSPNALESLYETISQHNAEVAAFGDSWPGALVEIRKDIKELKQIESTLARLECRNPREFKFFVSLPR